MKPAFCWNSEGLTDDDGNPRGLSPEERASSTDRTVFLDSDENEVSEETGIYGVEMSVTEEGMDGLKVTAKLVKKKNKSTCEVISIKPWGNRDCG